MEFANPLVVTLDNKIVPRRRSAAKTLKLYDQVQNGALDRVNARLKNIGSPRPPARTGSA
jgi:hypothetical protein